MSEANDFIFSSLPPKKFRRIGNSCGDRYRFFGCASTMSLMRVCFITPVLDIFKGGNHLPLLAAAKDVSFTVLTNRTKPQHLTLPSNVVVETVPGRLGPYGGGFADWRFASTVLRRFPPRSPFWNAFDIVHLNQTLGPQFLALNPIRPLLYTVHHPVSVDREVACTETKGLDRLRWNLRYALPIRFQRRIVRGVRQVLTVSETVRERLVRDYGCRRENIVIVPNGVDGEAFFPSVTPRNYDVVALGSFLHPRKGFPYLLSAYRSLAQDGLRIADIGRRSDEQRALLASINGVTVFGTIDHAALRRVLQNSSVLISTSLYEGFGLSLIEALACGSPAIAFGGGAVGEILGGIDPRLVVPVRDTEELVRRTREFFALPDAEVSERRTMYRRAVLQRYSLQGAAENLVAAYRNIIEL